jgi:hypothetical protein
VLVAGAAAPAAVAHPAREERPGAPQLDREVLVPPPLDDQLTPGATDADVSVDGFGNRFTVALKELPASPDTRAPRPARTAAWRWVSVDRGDSWDNVDVLPARADLLLPPASSVAVASDGPRTVLAEDHGGVVRVQPLVATGLGRFTAGTPGAVASGLSRRVDVAMRGTTVLLLAGHPSGAYAVYRSSDGGSSFSLGTVLPEVAGCSLAVDRRRASKVVVASCTRGDQVVVDVSTDDGASFTRRAVGRADQRAADPGVSVDVAPDGRLVVLSGMRLSVSRDGGRRWSSQDLQVERGEYRSSTLAVSPRGRVGVAAYRRTAPGEAWTVVTTIFTPGSRPVLSDFTAHDPVAPTGASGPPSTRTSLDFGADGRMQLVWSSTYLHSAELDRPLLRNVWSIRSNST